MSNKMKEQTFKAGDLVKIEGKLVKTGSELFPLAFENIKQCDYRLTPCGRFEQTGPIVLEMVKPAPELPEVGGWYSSDDAKIKNKVLDLYGGEVFYRYRYDGETLTSKMPISRFLEAYPTKIENPEL